MSTEIKRIDGLKWDDSDTSSINPRTVKQQLSLNRFFGGLPMNGRAIQITIGQEYVMLSRKQVRELAYTLMDCFDDDLYPSE